MDSGFNKASMILFRSRAPIKYGGVVGGMEGPSVVKSEKRSLRQVDWPFSYLS